MFAMLVEECREFGFLQLWQLRCRRGIAVVSSGIGHRDRPFSVTP
jgi:hypothetical protein